MKILNNPHLNKYIRVIGSKPKGDNLITEVLAVRSHFILRAIFRKYKKCIKNDIELMLLKQKN
jgi:hypothetical protein